MAQHVWASPRLFATYGGDVLLAQSYTRMARVYVGYLFDQLRPGQTFRADSWILENGVSISAQVWRDDLGERAAVRIIAPGVEEAADILYCDSGLLYWNALALEYPLMIQLGTRLKTLYPNLVSPQPSRHWTDTYPNSLYADENTGNVQFKYWPSFWSGKARLVVQGMHAKKINPQVIFGENIDPNTQGIWRAGGYWWVVNINSAVGVVVDRLLLPEDASVKAHIALSTLRAGSLTGIELAIAEACATSEMVPVGSPTTIFNPEYIAAVNDTGSAIYYGWKFARGKASASIVTMNESPMPEFPGWNIGQFKTNLFTIDASYDSEGGWSVDISNPYANIRSRPRTAITSIWVPEYGILEGRARWVMRGIVPLWGGSSYPACCYQAIGDTISPYYCWYDTLDRLQVVWYIQYQEEIESFDEIGEQPGECSMSFSWRGNHGIRGVVKGGFHVGTEPPSITAYSDNTDEYVWESYDMSADSSGGLQFIEEDAPSTSMTNCFYGTSICCGGAEVDAWIYDHFNEIKHVNLSANFGSQSEHYEYREYKNDHRLWSFIVSPHDCEAAYVLAIGGKENIGPLMTFDWSGSVYDDGLPVSGGLLKFEFFHIDPYGESWQSFTLSTLRSRAKGNVYSYGGWMGGCINLASIEKWVESEEARTVDAVNRYKIYSAHGSIDIPDNAYWPTLFPENVYEGLHTEQMPVYSIFSYLGDGMYYEGEGAYTSIGRYDFPNRGVGEMFIGGA